MIFPFVIMSIITGVYYSKSIRSEEERLSREIYDSISSAFNSAVDETDRFRSLLMSSSSVQTFFAIKDVSNISSYSYTMMNDMYKTINTYKNLSTKIESLGIYNYYTNYAVATDHAGQRADNFSSEPWYKCNSENIMFCTSELTEESEKTFSICYNVYGNYDNSEDLLATIVFTIKPDLLYDTKDDERAYILSLYDNYSNKIWTISNSDNTLTQPEPDFGMSEGITNVNFSRKSIEVTGKTHGNMLAVMLQREEAYTSAVLWFFCIGLVISLLIAIVLSIMSSVATYEKMEQIIESLNYMNNSDSEFSTAHDETSFILESISYMKEKNISLEKTLLEKIAELNSLQIAALQMQINPHYLFNTLNVLNLTVMDMNGVKNPASTIITKLSKILSYTINVAQLTATVQEEIDYCSEYIEIEKIRNSNFVVNWDVDESILKYKIPKFILQPVVENAFKHGMRHFKNGETGILNIKITKNENNISFEVSNNGQIIDDEKIEVINKNFNSDGGIRSIHIGLENVNRRIKLICGNMYGCEVYVENGFTVLKSTVDIKE